MAQSTMRLTVNGKACDVDAACDTALLYVLRNDLALNGPKYGCGLGECGACSILVDGKLARSCVLTLANVEGRRLTTLEGLADGDKLDPVQQAFVACAATQCGYCLNGMIMSARALLDANPDPSEADIREALRFNLCRCGAHVEIIAAVRLAATLARV
jgi:nicotinate dehydrogenase subunit A